VKRVLFVVLVGVGAVVLFDIVWRCAGASVAPPPEPEPWDDLPWVDPYHPWRPPAQPSVR
jgi:hypothetical protein